MNDYKARQIQDIREAEGKTVVTARQPSDGCLFMKFSDGTYLHTDSAEEICLDAEVEIDDLLVLGLATPEEYVALKEEQEAWEKTLRRQRYDRLREEFEGESS